MTDQSVIFDVCDCKVYEMLADTTGASGPVYGSAIDVPGINEFSGVTPQITSAELKGDCRIIARKGRIDSVNGTFAYGKLALDVLNAIYTGELFSWGVNDRGFRMKSGAATKYFKLEAVITEGDVGVDQVRLVFYKATATGGTFVDQKTDAFGQPKVDVNGIGIDSGPDTAVAPLPIKALMLDTFIESP